MKKTFAFPLTLLLAGLALAGCNGNDGGAGGGSAGRNPGQGTACLSEHAALRAKSFESTASAVAAFAAASGDCRSSLGEVRARAQEMQENGTTIDPQGE